MLSSKALKATAKFSLGLACVLLPSKEEAHAVKCPAVLGLGILFASALGFLLVISVNSFSKAEEIE